MPPKFKGTSIASIAQKLPWLRRFDLFKDSYLLQTKITKKNWCHSFRVELVTKKIVLNLM
jgi:hypothetical protein